MHTTTTSAARASVFAALWQRPGYIAAHARKDNLGAAWSAAVATSSPDAARLEKSFDSAVARITRLEDSALSAAGLQP